MITPLPGITATKPGSATQPFPGVFAEVRDESTGEPIEEGQGLLVLTRPWPSMLRTLYKEEERFIETYFKRFGRETYLVGDAARRDSDGYLWVIGRIDDVVNVSGHRLSTAEVESAIVAHPDVAEAAVIGQHDEDTGQAIVAFVTLQGDLAGDEQTVEGIRERSPSASASSPVPSASSGPTTCPRRARARSCAACCATSPRAARWAT
jgi:acetyl-CoA synthetase